jgi:hypothetical protein
MSRAAVLVKVILGETGEPDQDYDHDLMNEIVAGLTKAGYPGARHREFDKYQGVYLFVPNVGKFWLSYEGGMPALIPEEDPFSNQDEEGHTTEIPIVWEGEASADVLVEWINQRYAAKFAQMRAQADAEKFIDRSMAQRYRPATRRGK